MACCGAAQIGHVPLTQYLLDRRTPFEAKDLEGWAPLHWAAFTANLELFRLFLFRGAKHNATTNSRETTLHLASYYHKGHFKIRDTENYIGSSSDPEAIGLELLNMGIFVDVHNIWGETPLLLTTLCGLKSMREILASKGADLQATGERKPSALHYASRHNHLGAVDLLLNGGTNPLALRLPLEIAMVNGTTDDEDSTGTGVRVRSRSAVEGHEYSDTVKDQDDR